MIRRGLVPLLVLVVVLGLGLSGCGGGNDGASVASFCSAMKQDNKTLMGVSGSKDAIAKASVALKDLVDKSPSEVKDDVKTLADGFEKAASGQITSAKADTAKYTAASKRVVAYTKKQCGFDLDAA